MIEYKVINGKRKNSELIYDPIEKHLYVKKAKRKEGCSCICYQEVLCKNDKLPEEQRIKCSARVTTVNDSFCYRSETHHTNHVNHELIVKDMCSGNNMKRIATKFKEFGVESARKIETRHIFNEEIKK